MILLSHPTGPAHVRHAALALHRAGLLGEFWTGLHYDAPTWCGRLLPRRLREHLLRRAYPQELHRKIVTGSMREATRLLARRVGLGSLLGGSSPARALDRQVAHRLGEAGFDAVYAFEGGAEFSFRSAKSRNQVAIYDQPHGYRRAARRLLDEESILQPDWAETLAEDQASAESAERLDQEISLADVIIVPSTFARRTLDQPGLTRARVAIVPQGVPYPPNGFTLPVRGPSRRLRVLFAGPLTQRHGLAYLAAAVRQLGDDAELTLIGRRPAASCPALERMLAEFRHVPACSHAELLRLMHQHDVFVFPTLFDGVGGSLLEAMSMGLPVIATSNCAAPDLITEGVEGHLVPIRSADLLAERLRGLQRDPDRRASMGLLAAARAREFSWRRYETTLATRVREALSLAGHGPAPSIGDRHPEVQLPGVFPRR